MRGREVTTAEMIGSNDPDAVAFAQSAEVGSIRRPLIAAPSEGPTHYVPPTGDPTITLGGDVIQLGEQGRGAPMQLPSPAPAPPALGYVPATYTNPNHYEFAHNLGGRDARSPLASIPQGQQLAYELRRDWRRPGAVEAAAVDPGS